MEFQVLGPLEVRAAGARVPLGGARQCAVLAALLVDANRVVSVDRLINAVWDERPPSTARHQIRTSVSGLRKHFAHAGAERDYIATKPPGYALEVVSGELDSREFETRSAAARGAATEGDLVEAVGHARSALGLWRGPAWDGIPGHLVQAEATRLEERRLGLIEDCLQWELDLGRHHDIIGELITLANEHPLRERFHNHLMLALYRDGRQAQALEAYQRARTAFQQEFGLDPSADLQQLQQSILQHNPDIEAPTSSGDRAAVNTATARLPLPLQLPCDVDDFADRDEHLEQLTAVLASGGRPRRAVPVVTITGQGGVGKSALAIKVAHSVADSFPDGQLYVDLHSAQNNPAELLGRFLRALGVPGAAIPETLDERAELYRSHLAGSRRLVVLDNVADESQILPLLPGCPDCAVLITSRSRLASISGAHITELEVLSDGEAVGLLSRIASTRRLPADSQATADIARLCGNLPLALRIVAAKLTARPHLTAGQLAERLADERRRLDELAHGELNVRSSIDFSYGMLDPRSQMLFRRLALLDTPDFTVWVAAAALDTNVEEASNALDELVDAQLVQMTSIDQSGMVRFKFHDLVKVYAREKATADEAESQRVSVINRAVGAWLALAEQAHRKVYGGGYQVVHGNAKRWLPADLAIDDVLAKPLEWLECERPAIVQAVRQASSVGADELCWDLAVTASTVFESRSHYDDWWQTHQCALSSVRKASNKRGEAAVLNWLGELRLAQGRFDAAVDYCVQAKTLFAKVGDEYGRAISQVRIAHIDRLRGRYNDAFEGYQSALVALREYRDLSLESYVLRSIGQVKLAFLDRESAEAYFDQALAIASDIRSDRDRAQVIFYFGQLRLQENRLGEAGQAFEQVLSITHRLGDHRGQTAALFGLGTTKLRQRQHESAESLLRKALELAREVSDRPFEASVTLELGRLHHARGGLEAAARLLAKSREASHELGLPLYEAEALETLGRVRSTARDAVAAAAAWTEAEALFRAIGSPRADEVADEVRSHENQVA